MTHVSLCSGIGGIDIAAERAGFRTVAMCEIDPHCRRVLSRNFPRVPQIHDVKLLTKPLLGFLGIGTPTLVSAGFPCQPFSVAGSRKGDGDERHLWPEIARILCEVKPRWFLGENVRGLLSIDRGRVFGAVLRDLADMGFRVGWGCYGADEAAGFRHRRDRVFIVGYLDDSQVQSGTMDARSGEPGSQTPIAGGGGGNVDDSDRSRCDKTRSGPVLQNERGGQCLSGHGSDQLVDSDDERREELAYRFANGTGHADCRRGHVHIPGPKEFDQWRSLLEHRYDLAPGLTRQEEAELSVRPTLDGLSRRMALKMLGNAVVPDQIQPLLDEIAAFEKEVA